jgi:hypothetical protein
MAPCLREKYHAGPCNPFSDSPPNTEQPKTRNATVPFAVAVPHSDDYLGKLVVARDAQGGIVTVGKCVAYTDRPTLTIQDVSGKQVHWIADLCEAVALDLKAVEALIHQ